MTYWLLITAMNEETSAEAIRRSELLLPAKGLADISRAQSEDQIGSWLRKLNPMMPPEETNALAKFYWRLGHELMAEDMIFIPNTRGEYLAGEVTGACRREERAGIIAHIWPVTWEKSPVPAAALARFAQNFGENMLVEITDEDALRNMGTHVPALRKKNISLFRWIVIGTLIFELIYFWPRA